MVTHGFYLIKPIIPRPLQILVRRRIMEQKRKQSGDIWPIDPASAKSPAWWRGWPDGKRFAVILGHDVDTAKGRDSCLRLLDIEKKLGFISSFNFVPADYYLPPELRQTIMSSGFEIGVHGLKHDGRLFASRRVFERRAPKIDAFLKQWDAVGFYSPSMFRNLEWISELGIEYDCSTFDTDPFEPQPDGTGTIFPFVYFNPDRSRSYVELAYTMPQDHTLFIIFREKNIATWKKKLEWIVENGGMVRLNTHPDYMAFGKRRCSQEEYPAEYYSEFLTHLRTKYGGQYWHVLPRDLAKFWRQQCRDQMGLSGLKSEGAGPGRNPFARKKDAKKKVLIILENQEFRTDPRVKKEGMTLRDEGWEVHVICPALKGTGDPEKKNQSYSDINLDNIHVHSYPMKMGVGQNQSILKEYVLSLFHILRISWSLPVKREFSVIHICNPPDLVFFFGFVFKLFGSKVLFDQHDLFPEMVLIRLKGPLKKLFHRLALMLEYLSFRAADIIISTNNSYAEIAIERGRKDPKDVFVVRNGPMLETFVPEAPDHSLKGGLPHMACYAGVMNQEDGVLELIDVINYIVMDLNRKDIVFYLLGSGGSFGEIARKVERLKLKDFVKMPGVIRGKEFRTFLSTADVFMAPELSNPLNDNSTFIKIAEYMAIGKPIVSYDLKETRFTAGDSALYSMSGDYKAYANSILALLSDPVRSAQMGALGQQRVSMRFSWEHQQKILIAAYENALQR